MNSVPVKNGKRCVFRVVRVSGTIRKAEEEAIRNSREMILRAKRERGEQGAAALESLLVKVHATKPNLGKDVLMIHGSDEEEEALSDGDG